jgi:hypothetical protein
MYSGTRHAYCYAPEWATTNCVEHNSWNATASLNIRNEIVDDIKRQCTGTPRIYEEHRSAPTSGPAGHPPFDPS